MTTYLDVYDINRNKIGELIEKGEPSAAIRETKEELGIDIKGENISLIYRCIKPDKWGTLVDVYLVRQNIDEKEIFIQKEEVSEVKFIKIKEIENLFLEGKFSPSTFFAIDEVLKNI